MSMSSGRQRPGPVLVATVLASIALVGSPSSVMAQAPAPAPRVELSVGAGVGSLWDDETMLGRGVPLRVSVGRVIADRLLVAGDVDWLRHRRDSGYLAADGDLIGVFARLTWLFRDRAVRVRPTIGAGLGVMRSTGELRFRSLMPGPDGRPVEGPTDVAPWSLTRAAYDLHAGARIRASDRVAIRPEVTWRATAGTADVSTLEPPLLHIRTTVHVDVRLR